MKRALCTALLLAALALPARAVESFVPGIDDLPLMPGLTADVASALLFDKPAGRLVEISAAGRMAPETVRAYYAALMTPLGWMPDGEGGWLRDGERLRLELAATADGTLVRFLLAPH